MKFSVSMNNDTSVPYIQYGTDKQKAKARRFATADDKQINHMAIAIHNRQHDDVGFNKKVAGAILSLPVVAGVASAVATKGKASSKLVSGLKTFGYNAASLGVAIAAFSAYGKAVQNNPKVKEADKKHPIASFTAALATATAGTIAFDRIVKKVSPKANEKLAKIGRKIGIEKLAKKIDAAPEGIRKTLSGLSEKIALPKGVKESLTNLSSKVKVPQILKDGYKKIANLEVTKNVLNGAKKAGRYAKKNPVTAAAILLTGVVVGRAVKNSIEISATKAKLKDAQLKTANNLNEAYARENNSLKVSNMLVAEKLEEAKSVVAEDSAEEKTVASKDKE